MQKAEHCWKVKIAKIWIAQQRQIVSAAAERNSVCCQIQLQMTA